MRKRRIIILVVAIIAVLGLIWWALASKPPAPPNPVYAGHPLSYWLSPSAMTGGSARGEMQYFQSSLDSNAVPYLAQALKTHRDGVSHTAYNHIWPHLPTWLARQLPEPTSEANARGLCCLFLAQLGTAARPAIPELIRVLRADDVNSVRADAALALRDIASRDDKLVVEALAAAANKDTDIRVRWSSADALVDINPEAAAKAGVTNVPHP